MGSPLVKILFSGKTIEVDWLPENFDFSEILNSHQLQLSLLVDFFSLFWDFSL
jgi:hypothetical protein